MKFISATKYGLSLAAGLALLSVGAYGHHSASMFDSSVVKEMEGTVKEFQFTSPHTWLQVNVPNESGEVVEWSLEWGSPNQLARNGIRPSTFPEGAEVTVRTHPMRDGSPAGNFIGAKLDDGTIIGDWEE